ncbi:extracellular solute-binding protein [Metamycoplasma canadense]|uniref:Mycoplasma lipoprotein C-terminal domain-containing protein n=1 Tax=Metamycoplasma canadense TaxID=29554 RepID=A0A077L632_9BACT|nr:extracellular solute-binding protein [Metamycoplasma canadense]BAP39755.1 hypothetical protein MCAN360_0713 [Metamycoplasma canadense]
MIKKRFLSLLPTPVLSLGSFFCISCDEQEKQPVSVMIPFVEQHEKKSYAVMEKLINKFNEKLDKKYEENKLILVNSFDKKDIQSKVILQLNVQSSSTPSLVFSYPSLVSSIYGADRLYDLTSIADKTGISKNMLDYNNRLGFNNTGNIYNFPVGISSEILIINKKILSKVLYSLDKYNEDNKIKNINIFNLRKNTFFASLINEYKKSKNKKEFLDFNKDEIKKWDLNLENNFLNYDVDFQKFCSLLKKTIKKLDFNILYVKHVENYIYESLFKKAASNFEQFVIKYNSNYDIDFKFILEPNSKEYKIFYENIKEFYNNLRNKIINIDPDREHILRSSDLKNQLFSFVTSRVYEYDFDFFKKHENDLIIKNVPIKNNINQKKGTYFIQGLFLSAIKSKINNKNEVINLFLNWLYDKKNILEWKYENKIVKLTPVEYLSLNLGYVYPTLNFKEQYEVIKNNENKANNLILNNIENDNLNPFTELADYNSNQLRKTIKYLAMNDLLKNAQKNVDPDTAVKEFIEKLVNIIK